jgi:hypothetical protein
MQATTSLQNRPRSLSEVVQFANQNGHIDTFLREFLDEFYTAPSSSLRSKMLAEEPVLVEDAHANAYLGAVAEHLAQREAQVPPAWTQEAQRFLKKPYFPSGLESLKASLIVESPVAFRRRMIFVGSEPLYRPRKTAVGIGNPVVTK